MEHIYDPKSFRASENIPINDYFKRYSQMCYLGEYNGDEFYKHLQEEMNLILSPAELHRLEESCSLKQLTLRDEPDYMPIDIPEKLQTRSKLEYFYPITDSAKELMVIQCKDISDQNNEDTEFKFGNKRFLKTTTVATNASFNCDIKPGSDFIYSILIYRPFSISYGYRNSTEKLRFAYEIEALGQNTLANVVDKIPCAANIALFKEVENTKVDLSDFMDATKYYPSQSVFIDGVFYNDFRSPYAIDYSYKIIEWAKEKNIGKFKCEHMDMTQLDALQPRLGYPYVYMHQGNCEHIIVFSDAKLIQRGDCLNSKKYPRTVSLSRVSNVMCFICSMVHSKWMVLNCDKFPQEKVFLCTECCNSYLYINGEKVGDFKLYPYYDQELLTRHLN